jgi:hypothetical protein
MSNRLEKLLPFLLAATCAGAVVLATGPVRAEERPAMATPSSETAFTVDGKFALHLLMSLSDTYLQETADLLTLLAATDAVRSAEWEQVRDALAIAGRMTVPAVHWFARPDGTYWTLEAGLAKGNLAGRDYFPRVLAGQTVIGELVVSLSAKRNTAIVAVPVRGRDGSVVGALGASIYLDSLSTLLGEGMAGQQDGLLFYAIDEAGLGALHSDLSLIFTEPLKLGDADMQRSFREMLSQPEGTVTYSFRGKQRTVTFRKSPVTGWCYGIGVVKH